MAKKIAQKQESDNFIIQKIKKHSITSITLIDDAFDILKSFDAKDISDESISLFWSSLNNIDEESTKSMEEFNAFLDEYFPDSEINSSNDFDEDIIKKLWEVGDSYGYLSESLKLLFGDIYSKTIQIQRITQKIKQICNQNEENLVEIKELGIEDTRDVNNIEKTDVILLDYKLGDDNLEKSIKTSKNLAKKIYDNFSDKDLPFIVLMSSDPKVESAEEDFQKYTGWLKGLFYCQTKDNLEDSEKLKINLLTWIERRKEGVVIQDFVNSVKASLKKTNKEFLKSLNNLSLEDYAYVFYHRLKEEGQPLGEYVTFLLNSYLGRLLFEQDENIRKNQRKVDEISFEKVLLKHFMPSEELIEMYDSAVFAKPIESLHSRSIIGEYKSRKTEYSNITGVADGRLFFQVEEKKEKKKKFTLPYMRLGVIFYKDEQNPVLMVVNADCDLIFTEKGDRFPTTVLTLVTGRLIDVDKNKEKLEDHDIQFFQPPRDGSKSINIQKPFHIKWELKNAIFCEYLKLPAFIEKSGFRPIALLKNPFALKVQQAYANNFSRIALPISPPIQSQIKISVYYKSPFEEDIVRLNKTSQKTAFLIKDKKNKLQLGTTVNFLNFILESIKNIKDIYTDRVGKNDIVDANATKKLTTKLNQIAELISGFEIFSSDNIWHTFSKDDDVESLNLDRKNIIAICRNVTDGILEKWKGKQSFILINVEENI